MSSEHLIALEYHYPADYELWKRGIVDDYEAHTGLYILADSIEQALEWGLVVATHLLNHVHRTAGLTMQQFQHECRVIPTPGQSEWSHCLDFFQHVADGEMPDLDRMTTDAYVKWQQGQIGSASER